MDCLCSVLLLASLTSVNAYSTILTAGVLGVPGSNEASLYQDIADVMMQEDINQTETANADTEYYCSLNFEALNFDMSSGDAVYNSLEHARSLFQNNHMSVAVGPFIQIFSSNYVITRQLHLLTSPAGQNAALMNTSKVASILPETNSISQGIATLVKRFGWTDVAFLAQDDFSPVLSLNQQNVKVWPIRLSNVVTTSDDPELQRNLISLRQSEKNKFILHSSDRNVVMRVLQAAQKFHLLHRTKHWLITYPDFRDVAGGNLPPWPGTLYGLQLLREDRLPVRVVEKLNSTLPRLKIGLAVDVVGLLRHIMLKEARDCSRERIVMDNYVVADVVTWHIKNKTDLYRGALGLYVWDAETNRRIDFEMDILRYSGNITELGQMKIQKDRIEITLQDLDFNSTEPEEESGLGEDFVLYVATKLADPFVIRHGDGYDGFSHDLLQELAKKVKFKFELFEVKDTQLPDGTTLNGMVEALTTGNASMAVGAIEVTSERQKVISFSYTILSSVASILIKKGETHSSLFQFLAPFSTELWLMILLFINVASFTLYVMSRFDPTQEGNLNRFDLKESLWYGWNILLQGTTDYSPSTTSMRAIIAFFWFCVLIIDAAYTANLAAFRTLQQLDDRIKTLHDLASQTKLLYGVERDSEVMNFFKTKTEDPYERMWAFMKLNEEKTLLKNTTEIVEMVKQKKLAFIADGVTNDYYVKQHCDIESIEQNFGKKDFGLGFPRGAPYLDDINKALLQLKEEGCLDKLKEKWWMTEKNCTDSGSSRSISQKATAELELTNMTGVFIVFGFSLLLAVVVDVSERLYWKCCHKKSAAKLEVDAQKQEQTEPLEMDGNVVENYYTFS